MTEFTANEMRRLIEMLPKTDPTNDDYYRILRNLEMFACHSEMIEMILKEAGKLEEESNIISVEFRPPEPEVKEPDSLDPLPASESAPSAPVGGESGADIDLVAVRYALREAKKKGADIPAVLSEFGADNIKGIKPEQYAALVKRLEEFS